MRPNSSRRSSRAPLVAVLLLCLALGACKDDATDPTGVVLTEETQSSLRLGLERSALPTLVELSGSAAASAEASKLWEESWTMTLPEARVAREAAHIVAASRIASVMEHDELVSAVDEIGVALAVLEGLDRDAFRSGVVRRVDYAIEAYGRSRIALEEGATEDAVRSLFEASDALREVTPRRLASLLYVTSEAALGRISSDASYSEETLQRAVRLVRGADSAIRAEDYPTAIRRAYYANLLLGVELP